MRVSAVTNMGITLNRATPFNRDLCSWVVGGYTNVFELQHPEGYKHRGGGVKGET